MDSAPAADASKAPARFRRTRVIAAEHIDDLDHVNNVVWLRFVVELAAAHSGSVGLDLDRYRELGGVWVARRHEIEYLAPARAGDVVTEETWISNMRAALCVRHSRFGSVDGTELVVARTEWAYVNAATQRPTRVHPAVRERFSIVGGGETP